MMAEDHTMFTQHACLPLAETASTFGEMMLVDRLLATETDEAVKRDLVTYLWTTVAANLVGAAFVVGGGEGLLKLFGR
jgi:oligoendopeptidase F